MSEVEEVRMSRGRSETTRVTFDLRTFFSLLGIAVAGVATTVASLYSIQLNMKNELVDMDRRWVERSAQVEERLRLDIKMLSDGLPPPEIRSKIAELDTRLNRLEDIKLRASTVNQGK